MFSRKVLSFYKSLNIDGQLPPGITCMYPFREEPARTLIKLFYEKYFSDENHRVYLFGINPGRFGGGVTGIPFTDPVQLNERCGIENALMQRRELSAEFVYSVIEKYGGAKPFYSRFFITAISPVGFLKGKNNYNYYDDDYLLSFLEPSIKNWMKKQLAFGCNRKIAVCLGTGKNFTYLDSLNKTMHYFDEIVPIEHPRFIMQYRRKQLNKYIDKYLDLLDRS